MKNLSLLIPEKGPEPDRWSWATVHTANPLRIRLDGEAAALNIDPENLVGALFPGERVWVQITGRRVLVIGRAGGAGVPTGSVQMFMGEVNPPGWLMCNGDTFDANQYPVLADILGGNVLPDFRRRFPLGYEWLVNGLGDEGGSDLIGVNHLPSHVHDMYHKHEDGYASGGAHYHTVGYEALNTTTTGSSSWRVTDINNKNGGTGTNFTANTSTESHAHWVDIPPHIGNTGATGDGQSYMPRYVVVHFIIKT